MRVVISACGLVTAVGRSAPAACAAIRAGIARPRRVSYFMALDEETQEETPVTGYPIRGYTEGFNMVGCWLRLARGAVVMEALTPGSAILWRLDDKDVWKLYRAPVPLPKNGKLQAKASRYGFRDSPPQMFDAKKK